MAGHPESLGGLRFEPVSNKSLLNHRFGANPSYRQTQPADLVTDQDIVAVTSPIYLEFAGAHAPITADAIRRLIEELDAWIGWVHERADCDSEKDRQRLADVFVQAKQVLIGKLEQ